jgi:hypothetical protein
MPFFLLLGLLAIQFILGEILRPRVQDNSRPQALKDFNIPTADETRSVPVIWGTVRQDAPNVLWFGDLRSVKLTKGIKSGIFATDRLPLAYRYSLGIDFALCHGPVDALVGMQTSDDFKKIWTVPEVVADTTGDGATFTTETQGANTATSKNARILYGGDADFQIEASGEGGLYAECTFYKGSETAPQDPYLLSVIPPVSGDYFLPAHRGLCRVVWKGPTSGKRVYNVSSSGEVFTSEPFLSGYVGISPNLKPFSFIIKRTPNMLSTDLADTHYDIADGDANPADVIYELLTNDIWGMGLVPEFIDYDSFKYAQQAAFEDGLGFSSIWDSPKDISEVIEEVLRYIDGVIFTDLETGLITIKLARKDYDTGNLPVIDQQCAELISYSRGAWDETTNDLRLRYVDRVNNFKEKTVVAQDLANAIRQNNLVSAETSYLGISNSTIATKIAQRDLRILSTPLAKLTLKVNRKAYDFRPGTVFKFSWQDFQLSIDQIVMRVTKIAYGDLDDPYIEIDAIEDIFSLGDAIYSVNNGVELEDPGMEPSESTFDFKVLEAPYFYAGQSNRLQILCKKPNFDQFSFNSFVATDDDENPYYKVSSSDQFTPFGFLKTTLADNTADYLNSTILEIEAEFPDSLDTIQNFSEYNVLQGNNLALITDPTYGTEEVIGFQEISYNETTSKYELTKIYRGLMDTVPQNHAEDSQVWFFTYGDAIPTTSYTIGDNLYVKLRSTAVSQESDFTAPTNISINARAFRPLPPANLEINGSYSTSSLSSGSNVALTWAHRNKVAQGETLVKQSYVGFEAEAGTEYYIKFFNQDNDLLTTVGPLSHNTTSYTYTNTAQAADNGGTEPTAITLYLYAKLNGVFSYQAQKRTLIRSGTALAPLPFFGGLETLVPNYGYNATSIKGAAISDSLPADGQVLVYDNSLNQWVPDNVTLNGDLIGTTASATVIKIQNKSISTNTPIDGQSLTWNKVNNEWAPITPLGGIISTKYSNTPDTHTAFNTWQDIDSTSVVVTPGSTSTLFCTFTFSITMHSLQDEKFAVRFVLDGSTYSETWITAKDATPADNTKYSLTVHGIFEKVTPDINHEVKMQWHDASSDQDVIFTERRLTVVVGKPDLDVSFDPINTGKLRYWFKARDLTGLLNNDQVPQLTDYSGYNNHFTQGSGINRGLYRVNQINGLPAVQFTAANVQRYSRSNFLTTNGEAFFIMKVAEDPAVSGGGINGYAGFGTDVTLGVHYPYTDGVIYDSFGTSARKSTVNPTQSLANWHIYNVQSSSGNWTSRINGVDIYTTNSNTPAWASTLTIGGDNLGEYLEGMIAEVLVFNNILTAQERQVVLNYLLDTYGI